MSSCWSGSFGSAGRSRRSWCAAGWPSRRRARAFLAADEEHPPTAFAGIERAIEPILRHVCSGERITIHGDYDVDGICSTAVLVRSLRRLGANVDWYLPDRATDGYGLNLLTVQRLAARGTRLLVTVDCAITAVDEVARALELGMEVVVTDHHAPRADGVLPEAPIVHPAVCSYPCLDLCATAVAYKLALALEHAAAAGSAHASAGDASGGRALEEDLDLVALATIADVVTLVGENRTLVRRGLRALAGTAKPGLRALMAVARVDPGKLNERSVAFALAPRLNAAGRLYRADAGLELILTEEEPRAAQVAEELGRANHERRQVELRIRYEAEAQIAAARRAGGLCARGRGLARRRDRDRRLAPGRAPPAPGRADRARAGTLARGRGGASTRSTCSAVSPPVAGTCAASAAIAPRRAWRSSAERVEEFAEAFCAHTEEVLSLADTAPLERVDAVVGCDQLGMELAEELLSLAPFGRGNPGVSLLVADAVFSDLRPMGEGKHVRFTVESGGARSRGVAFGTGGRLPVAEGEPAEATFTLEINEWNGVTEPRLLLRQVRAAEQSSEAQERAIEPLAVRDLRPAETLVSQAQEHSREELTLFAVS